MSIEGQGHFFTIYFPGYICLCFTRPRYQVSVYRTIGHLVSMYINDIEDEFYLHGIDGIEIDSIKLFLLLYEDDITIFSETAEGLQDDLNLLGSYCTKWKLTLNTEKTKIVVFRKGGILPRNLRFYLMEKN